jgi:hypothetical protein
VACAGDVGLTAQTFILPNQKAVLLAYIDRLPMARKWRVEISLYRKRRSDAQNRYLWGIAYKALKDATGQPADDWHEYFLGEHFGWEAVEMFGKKKLRPLNRSSKLTTMEFMDFVDFIQMRAAEHNVYIPDPNESEL